MSAGGEYHGPRHGTGTTKEFAVNEIAQPSQGKGDRSGDDNSVRYLPEGQLTPAAKQYARNNCACKPSMERHAAMPDGDDFKWILQVLAEIVKLVE